MSEREQVMSESLAPPLRIEWSGVAFPRPLFTLGIKRVSGLSLSLSRRACTWFFVAFFLRLLRCESAAIKRDYKRVWGVRERARRWRLGELKEAATTSSRRLSRHLITDTQTHSDSNSDAGHQYSYVCVRVCLCLGRGTVRPTVVRSHPMIIVWDYCFFGFLNLSEHFEVQ